MNTITLIIQFVKRHRTVLATLLLYAYTMILTGVVGIFFQYPLNSAKVMSIITIIFGGVFGSWTYIIKGGWLAAAITMGIIQGALILIVAFFPEIMGLFPLIQVFIWGLYPMLLLWYWK